MMGSENLLVPLEYLNEGSKLGDHVHPTSQ